MLRAKLLGDWESLEFMRDFWNPEYDERDILQYRRLAPVWRMRESGASFKAIADKIGEDTRKCCALVSSREELPSVPGPDVSQPRGAWEA
ncbi:MAG: hypothetical protein E6K84_08360 [Thaumarchaeota archaeon]|nr:MAG: hypothetical protein E6K84_08360 [Nitrososphaerota archaeon]